MVFEPNYVNLMSSSRKNIGITQTMVELKLPTNEESVKTIYSVSAKSTIMSNEKMGQEVSFTGLIDFQAVYEGEGMMAIDYSAEFKDKFIADKELLGEIILSSNVVDVQSSVVSSGIRVVAIIETTIDIIETNNYNALVGVNGEDAYKSLKQVNYFTYLGIASEKFEVSEEFELNNARKVLMVTPNVCLQSVDPNDNFIKVSGNVAVEICYQAGDDVTDIRTVNKVIDFDIDVAFNGVNQESSIENWIAILFNEIKVSTMIEEDSAVVSFYAPIIYKGYIFDNNSLDVVDDLYIKDNYLSITSENFETVEHCPNLTIKDGIQGTAEILETSPFIDEILGVCSNNLVVASAKNIDDKIIIEGVANTTVMYYTKETASITSVKVEIPFFVEERSKGDFSSIATIAINNITARSKRGKEIEVNADLCVYADTYNLKNVCIISDVALGDKKPEDDCVLYLYMVKPNQTVWEIAKEMNVSVDTIMEQNSDIQFPLVGGERLVIYKPKLAGV